MTMRRAQLAMRSAAALLAALLFCGCDTLPAGDPPAGPLADNTPTVAGTETARRNRRVTALITYALQHGLTALAAGDDAALEVARDAAKIAGFAVKAPDGALPILKCDGSGMALFRPDGTELWRCE